MSNHEFDVPEHIDHLEELIQQNCAEAFRMGDGALSTLAIIVTMMETGRRNVAHLDEFRLMGAYMEDYRVAMRKIQSDLKQARELTREL